MQHFISLFVKFQRWIYRYLHVLRYFEVLILLQFVILYVNTVNWPSSLHLKLTNKVVTGTGPKCPD